MDLGSGVWLIPASEARDLNDSAKPLEWRYSRIDLWLKAACSEVKRDEQRSIWRTDLLFVCLRGGTLLVMIKEGGVLSLPRLSSSLSWVTSVVVGRWSSVVVAVVRFALKVQWATHVYRESD